MPLSSLDVEVCGDAERSLVAKWAHSYRMDQLGVLSTLEQPIDRKQDGQEQDEQQNDQFHSYLLRVVRAQIQALTHFFLLSVAGKAGKQILR
jgi:hypothetical protein